MSKRPNSETSAPPPGPVDLPGLYAAVAKDLKESYFRFFCHFWSSISAEPLHVNWHIKFVCDELQRVGELVIARQAKKYDLIINIPPGSSKSSMCTVLFPAWLWARDASLRVISGSYESSLSMAHAGLSKDCIQGDEYRAMFPDVTVRRDADAKSLYMTTDGGERVATATGRSITGRHAHLILVDDPANPQVVNSDAKLKQVNDWMKKTLPTRKVEKENTPTILVMQRLRENDPTGEALKEAQENPGLKIRHICLPATSEFPVSCTDDVVDFCGESKTVAEWYADAGGLLDPVRMSDKALAEAKSKLGSTEYAGQFGQQPFALEGNYIKRTHFGTYQLHNLPDGINDVYIDTATSEQELKDNDPTGILIYRVYQSKVYLVYFMKGRWTSPELRAKINWVGDKFLSGRRSKVYLENKSNARSTKQELEAGNTIYSIILDNPVGGKLERVKAEESVLEARRVLVPDNEPWVEDFINQVCGFPNMTHDEEVDCLTGAIRRGLGKPKIGLSSR